MALASLHNTAAIELHTPNATQTVFGTSQGAILWISADFDPVTLVTSKHCDTVAQVALIEAYVSALANAFEYDYVTFSGILGSILAPAFPAQCPLAVCTLHTGLLNTVVNKG